MILKAKKKKSNFTQIQNSTINDKRISARAKGVLLYLLSKSEDWVVRKTELHTNFKEGREAIWNAFKELIEFKYVLYVTVKNQSEDGKWSTDITYIVYEVPIDSDEFNLLYDEDVKEISTPKNREPKTRNREPRTRIQSSDAILNKDNEILDNNIYEEPRLNSSHFYSQYCEESGKYQSSSDRNKTERELSKLSFEEKQLAVSKFKEFIQYRKEKQQSDFGEYNPKYIPLAATYLADKLWEDIPEKTWVYAELCSDNINYRYRYESDDTPCVGKEIHFDKEAKKHFVL